MGGRAGMKNQLGHFLCFCVSVLISSGQASRSLGVSFKVDVTRTAVLITKVSKRTR